MCTFWWTVIENKLIECQANAIDFNYHTKYDQTEYVNISIRQLTTKSSSSMTVQTFRIYSSTDICSNMFVHLSTLFVFSYSILTAFGISTVSNKYINGSARGKNKQNFAKEHVMFKLITFAVKKPYSWNWISHSILLWLLVQLWFAKKAKFTFLFAYYNSF